MTIINTTEKQRSPETKNNEIQKFDIEYHEVITKINNIASDHQSLIYIHNNYCDKQQHCSDIKGFLSDLRQVYDTCFGKSVYNWNF